MQKEGLRMFALAADLEGSKILEPRTIRRLRIGLPPELELVEVVDRDLAIVQAIK